MLLFLIPEICQEKEKLIGSRDGLFYIDEENHRYKSFKVPQLRSNMIFSCLYYQNEYYIGTYGGGMYVLNPATLTLRDFEPDGGKNSPALFFKGLYQKCFGITMIPFLTGKIIFSNKCSYRNIFRNILL